MSATSPTPDRKLDASPVPVLPPAAARAADLLPGGVPGGHLDLLLVHVSPAEVEDPVDQEHENWKNDRHLDQRRTSLRSPSSHHHRRLSAGRVCPGSR